MLEAIVVSFGVEKYPNDVEPPNNNILLELF